jgi:hypothetical protein
MKQMHLIDDDQLHQTNVSSISALSCDYIPLLWRRNNDVRLLDLLLAEMYIPSKLLDLDVERLEAGLEVPYDL